MERKRYERLDETMFHTVLPNGLPIYVDEKPEYGKQFAFFATHYGGIVAGDAGRCGPLFGAQDV